MASQPDPSARILGAYELVEALGAGPIGEVHSARVAAPFGALPRGSEVIVTILSDAAGVSAEVATALEAEGRGARRVKNERVVRTHDLAVDRRGDAPIPFAVTDALPGRPLRALVEVDGALPEPVVRALAVEMSAAVGAVHAQEILHLALSPDTVTLDDDGAVRLSAVGVAPLVLHGIRDPGPFGAPELVAGGAATPAADLYSLGRMLEYLSGGGRAAPSPFLRELVAMLTAEDPADRFPSAAAVHALLQECEDSDWWLEVDARRRAEEPHVPLISAAPGAVADSDVLDELHDHLLQARAGVGTTIHLEGSPGSGRTALLRDLAAAVDPAETHVLYGAYRPLGGMGALSDAVSDHFGQGGIEEAVAPYLAATPDLVPGFATTLRSDAVGPTVPPVQGEGLHSAFVQLMRSLAAERPLVWLIDDLDHASGESRQLVQSMIRAAAGHPVLLIVTTRPGAPIRELLDARSQAQHHVIGVPPPEGPLPDPLAGVDPGDRALLETAALSDFVFDGGLVALAFGRPLIPTLLTLAGLSGDHGPLGAAGARWRFSHELVHAALIDGMDEERARGVHTALAGALSESERLATTLLTELPRNVVVSYTRHALSGEQPLPAARSISPALDHLWKAHLNRDAVELADRALAIPGLLEGRARLDVLVRLARSLEPLGRTAAQGEALSQALLVVEATEDDGARARIRRLAGVYATETGDHERAIDLFDEAVQLGRAIGDRFLLAQLDGDLGNCYRRAGRSDLAQSHLERYLAVLRETKDVKRRGETIFALGRVAYRLGNYKVATAHYGRAVDLMRRAGDPHALLHVLAGMSAVLLRVGSLDDARDHLNEYLDLVQRLGLRKQEIFARTNLAALHLRFGEPARCREHLAAHLRLATEMGDRRREAIAQANLGSLHVTLGDHAGAEQPLARALVAFRELGEFGWEAFVLHELGRIAEHENDPAEAEARYREALTARRRAENQAEVAETLIALGRTALSQGRKPDARWNFEEAVALAREFDAAGEEVVASAYLARVGGLDPASAVRTLERHRVRLAFAHKLEAAFVLYEATGDAAHLDQARTLLEAFRSKLPVEEHEPLVKKVPLHAAIEWAWLQRTAE